MTIQDELIARFVTSRLTATSLVTALKALRIFELASDFIEERVCLNYHQGDTCKSLVRAVIPVYTRHCRSNVDGPCPSEHSIFVHSPTRNGHQNVSYHRLLGAKAVLSQEVTESIDAPSAAAELSQVSGSGKWKDNGRKYRRSTTGNTGNDCGNASGSGCNTCCNAESGTDNSSAVEDAAVGLLGSELNGTGHLLALALGDLVGSGGSEASKGGDSDGGETHVDGLRRC